MAARDFINETLLRWLEEEIESEAKGVGARSKP
jgi:hypothetical protein